VTTREPEWTEHDVAERLALAEYRESLCPCCNLPKGQVWVHERDAPRYRVSKWMCHAGKTLAESQDGYFKDRKPTPGQAALKWSVRIDKG
jgi:hypothetical protein